MPFSTIRLGLFALPALLLAATAQAQQRDVTVMRLGDAVVTGFSGTVAPDPGKRRPPNKSVADLTFIDPDGPSARVIDIARPGHVWDGSVFAAPKTFNVLAKDVGQVFGVALDRQSPPNIYLAATSVFGLNIVKRGRDGQPERLKTGGPGAGWMKGQFGLELQGGPGAIYRVDGSTGVVTLFANVTLDGVPNPGPGLGNLAYDDAHRQLFVSDLHTGMIHRFDLDGRELGRYDHGVTGRNAGKLAPLAYDPKTRPNIATTRFDSQKPATWGYAPAPRQVWALAVHRDRLYYSVAAGPQIWSVGIARDGSFANDARWEFDVPAQAEPLPVTDIAFSEQGAMLLAQRALVAGAYDYSAFTQPGEPQVFRVWPKQPNDPPSPGRWKLEPEEYAVGFAANYRNTNGGIALGYGYDQNGALATSACEAALWTTGQNLRNAPALKDRLEPGGPLVVHGLQGLPSDQTRKANTTPPWPSYSIPYGDDAREPHAAGDTGSVRIYTTPCPVGAAPAQPTAAVGSPGFTPIGCVGPNCGKVCTPTCICPPGTEMRRGECVKVEQCQPGYIWRNGECVRALVMMPAGQCTPPMIPGPTPGSCRCPLDMEMVNGHCVASTQCKPPFVAGSRPGTCVCPQGFVQQGGACVAQVCPAPLVPGPCVDGTPIDLGINKTGATTPVQRPEYVFDITVTNNGAPFNGSGVITVTDTVPPGMTFNSIGGGPWTCAPPSGGAGTVIICTYNGPGVTTGQVLPVIHVDARANGEGPYPPFTNCAVVGTKPEAGLSDIDPKNDQSCVTVTKPGTVTVEKKVKNDTHAEQTAISALTFPFKLTCPPTINATFTLHDGQSHNETNVPYGSVCTVTETGLPPPPPNACNEGYTAVWLDPVVTPNGVTINAPVTAFTVVNELTCRKDDKETGTVTVEKKVKNDTDARQPVIDALTFQIKLVCPSTVNSTFTLHNAGQYTENNVPYGSTCTVSEIGLPPPPPVGCKQGYRPTWAPPMVTPGGTLINAPFTAFTVVNELKCEPIDKICAPPQIMSTDGVCICPPPMTPGALPGQCLCPQGTALQDGQCVKIENECTPPLVMIPGVGCGCPDGTVLQGRECVKAPPPPPVCQPPMIPGPVPGQCVCGPGYVLSGKECVKEVVCKPPLVPNGAGTDCTCPKGRIMRHGKCVEVKRPKRERACPKGMVRRNGECVERERKRPAIEPGDVIRVIPGLIGPGSGGRRGGGEHRGTGDTGGGKGVR
jgi:hypothetical protein